MLLTQTAVSFTAIRQLALAVALGLMLGGPLVADAAQYVVAGNVPRASDSNPGTAALPLRTIQRAADLAMAGDTVLIEPGTYAESVTLHHSGLPGRPITFQATKRHGVTLVAANSRTYTLFQSGKDAQGRAQAPYITLRGIVFGHTSFRGWSGFNDFPDAVYCAQGWRVEDCVVEDNMGLAFGNVGRFNSDDVTILRTIFQGCYTGGGGASGDGSPHPPNYLKNPHIIDCIFRRNNPKNLDPGGYNGANKFLWHDGLVMDGVISYDNNGTGTWLDYGSINFTIRNCTFFGNHAGYCLGLDGKPGGDKTWAGAGFWSEANPGPGLIENNVVYSNLGSGIGDLDSGSQGAITIRNNLLVDNGGAGVEFRGMDDHGDRRLGPADVTGNLFKDNQMAWATSVEENIPSTTPDGMGIVIDRNTYDISPTATAWASWKPTAAAKPTTAHGLAQIRSVLGAARHGTVADVSFRGPLIHVYAYPTAADALDPDPAKLDQVPSQQAERLTIDSAIATAGGTAGVMAVIPVFGRKALTGTENNAWCQVYDLQARYLRLSVPNSKLQRALESAVTPYAIIAPTYLRVRLTHVSQYDIAARLVSVGRDGTNSEKRR